VVLASNIPGKPHVKGNQTMPLTDILPREGVLPALRVTSKKMLLEAIADQASIITKLPSRLIFDALLQRERLGSTGIGGGIAIPHSKFEGLDKLVGLFARVEKPIAFDALDGEPVDLVFVLMAPEGAGADHLKGLSKVARVLRSPSITAKLRASKDGDVIHALLTQTVETSKAA
jgi:nitrogen PTS system EIIA component